MARSILSLFPAISSLLAYRAKGEFVPQAAFTDAGFGISVHCWSFKEYTLFEAIEMAAAAGAGGVELYPGQKLGGNHGSSVLIPEMPERELHAVIEELAKNHLVAHNLGVIDIPNNEPAARKVFEFAEKLSLYGITTESSGSITLLERLTAEFDIKVCFHNHPKPTALWKPDTLWKALEGRHQNLGYCADIGHWASSGLDPLESVRSAAPRIRSFHLKDRSSTSEWSHDRPFGTGIIDIPAILDEVRKHGFAGNVSIEYEHNWKTNLPEIAQCVGYLRAYSKSRP